MKALKFTLKGKTAFFKVPEVNEYCYFTYGNIHKPVLLGMFGAILGYSGYNRQKQSEDYPEYYTKLHGLKISIVPESKHGYFYKKIQSFNNSVGYASGEQGGNLIVNEQWLENPCWTIYVQLGDKEALKLVQMMRERKCVYIPYLGTNEHPAAIEDVQEIQLEKIDAEGLQIQSLALSEKLQFDLEEMSFKYEEYLPLSLDKITNCYQIKKFILTDAPLEEADTEIYTDGEKNLAFY